jgi:hypothetical protein
VCVCVCVCVCQLFPDILALLICSGDLINKAITLTIIAWLASPVLFRLIEKRERENVCTRANYDLYRPIQPMDNLQIPFEPSSLLEC